MKRFMTALVLMSLLLVLGSGSVFADKLTPVLPEFRTAVDTFDLQCGTMVDSTVVKFSLEVSECNGTCTRPGDIVASNWVETTVSASDDGKTTRWTQSLPDFAPIATRLTDGNASYIAYGYTAYSSGAYEFLHCGLGMDEVNYFRGQAGPNGIDLAGYTVSSIAVKFDTIELRRIPDVPWTEVHLIGNVSYNRPATREACVNDGWKKVVRSDGSGFKNQGDCVSFVNTGK